MDDKLFCCLFSVIFFFPHQNDNRKRSIIRSILGICIVLAEVLMYNVARLEEQKKRFEESETKPLLANKDENETN